MNALPARTIKGALVAADKQGNVNHLTLRLIDGITVEFRLAEVMDDALLGQRLLSDKPCIIPMHAIAMIEFES